MKKHLKLIIKTILILLVMLIITDIVVGIVFSKITDKVVAKAPDKMMTEYTIDKVKADIIILGSSRANRHYNPSIIENHLHLSTFNCGKSGQMNFNYSAAMFDAITKRYTPKLIIFDIEGVTLNKAFADQYNLSSDLHQYYFKNSICKEIIDKTSTTEKYKLLSSMYRYNSKFTYILDQLKAPKSKIDRGYLPLPNKGYKLPIKHKTYETDKTLDPFMIDLLERTLKLAKQKNIKLIFSISPQYQSSNYKTTLSYQRLQEILAKYNIPLIDNGDISLITSPQDYNDIMHLNTGGADKFTEAFVKQIQDL